MQNYTWPTQFREIFERAVKSYKDGNTKPATLFNAEEKVFLSSIGCTEQELFDFVEDHARFDEPTYEQALLTTAVRRDYFLVIQNGKPSGKVIDMKTLPAKSAEVAGVEWLPRIIVKARAKLRGEMPPELMYGCGGDRPFLESMNVDLADFLRVVWAAGDDDQKVIDYVLRNAGRKG
jgi:hypothetical protein